MRSLVPAKPYSKHIDFPEWLNQSTPLSKQEDPAPMSVELTDGVSPTQIGGAIDFYSSPRANRHAIIQVTPDGENAILTLGVNHTLTQVEIDGSGQEKRLGFNSK